MLRGVAPVHRSNSEARDLADPADLRTWEKTNIKGRLPMPSIHPKLHPKLEDLS